MKLPYFACFISALSLFVACKDRKNAAPTAGGPPVAQVVVITAQAQSVAEKIALVGTLLANEAVEVKSEVEGTVSKIQFDEGQTIEKGAPLIELDDRKIAAELQQAEASFKLSESNAERAKKLFQENLISKQEHDQLSAAFQMSQANLDFRRQQLRETKIRAPFSGIVGARFVSPGQVISKNSPITWVTDLDPVKVEINVPERFLGQLKVGQPIEIGVSAYPNDRFQGRLYFVAENVNPADRTVMIKAEIPNSARKLKPGMFANLDLTMAIREKALVIPEVAVSRVLDNNRAMIFVVDSNNIAQIRPVELGIRLPGKVEVTKGLQPGESVIVEGVQKTIPGAPVKLAPPEAAAPYTTTNTPSRS